MDAAFLYKEGIGIEKNPARANFYYTLASELGSKEASDILTKNTNDILEMIENHTKELKRELENVQTLEKATEEEKESKELVMLVKEVDLLLQFRSQDSFFELENPELFFCFPRKGTKIRTHHHSPSAGIIQIQVKRVQL